MKFDGHVNCNVVNNTVIRNTQLLYRYKRTLGDSN